jgi:hypothetical protein
MIGGKVTRGNAFIQRKNVTDRYERGVFETIGHVMTGETGARRPCDVRKRGRSGATTPIELRET